MLRTLLILLFVFLLNGCCSRTTLILLPDDAGEKSKVVMQTERGEQILDTPYSYTELSAGTLKPRKVRRMSAAEFERKWGKLANLEPARPQSFILHFLSGSIELTKESIDRLPEVIAALQQEDPVAVNIIGHSDAVGNEEYNYRLSLERAKVVYDLLQAQAPWLTRIVVESYGENDPLVPTPDNVAEPRNRRVEVLIR